LTNDNVYISVIHYPAKNKEGRWVCTSFTTLDFHDVARPVRTYELQAYYIVQPLEAQQFIIKEQLKYWTEGFGSEFNPKRSMAGSMVRVVSSITQMLEEIKKEKSEFIKTKIKELREKITKTCTEFETKKFDYDDESKISWIGRVFLCKENEVKERPKF